MAKKKSLIIAVCIAALTACLFGFAACDEPLTVLEQLDEKVSSRQTTQYIGQTDDAHVSVSTLDRETVFVADGSVGDMETVTSVIVTLPQIAEESIYTYALRGADGKVEGTLSRSVIGNKLVAKIENASALGALQTLTVTDSAAPDAPITFELADKMEGAITPLQALDAAYNHFKAEIDAELAAEDGMQREIYIRFVNGKTDMDSEYYWYVSFVADRNDDMSVLLDPLTGEVVTSRVRP